MYTCLYIVVQASNPRAITLLANTLTITHFNFTVALNDCNMKVYFILTYSYIKKYSEYSERAWVAQ